MGKLLKKNPQDLNDLPSGWITREELIQLIIRDPNAKRIWNELALAKIPGRVNIEDLRLISLFNPNSWRLTRFGGKFLSMVYTHWGLCNDTNLRVNGRILVNTGRILHAPWDIKNSTVTVWNQQTHFELAMFDGDIRRFVDFYVPKITS
jgi:hypothetical protein